MPAEHSEVQRGTPSLTGKRHLLEQIQRVLLAQWTPQASESLRTALVLLRSALSMTGTLEEGDRKLRLLVMQFLEKFESKAGASKPLGFYTWSPHVQLPSRPTNPTSKPALDEDGEWRCFLPPSDSHEGRVVKELFGMASPPPGFQARHHSDVAVWRV